ncbi:hypothetical protein ATCVMO0605SPH_249R [Acanthocystis turfacea Chlorella virus MO0605SPH]|nr:hypothetical protein ATCVMO0605SPH_249R [Acanthocystis turfacea Chlorella virus MO0605SPH]
MNPIFFHHITMVSQTAILCTLVLFATTVSGSSIIYNNCGNNVTIYRHLSNNTKGVYSQNSTAVLCADPASTQFTIPVDMVSDELDAGCDVFVSFDFPREDMFNLDGSVYDDNNTCPESPSDKMSCYDGAGISPHRTVFNIGDDVEIYLCSVPIYTPFPVPAPVPAPVPPGYVQYSVTTASRLIGSIICGVILIGVILFIIVKYVHRYEDRQYPYRDDNIPRYDRGFSYSANV